MPIQVVNQSLFDLLVVEAKASPRLRKNFNFHKDLNDKCQRLLNALEPGTVMPIHRHRVDEMQILLQGCMKVMAYDEEGRVVEEYTLNPKKGEYGIQIPANTWHSIEILEPGTVIFEVKEGPYTPCAPEDILGHNK